MNRRAADIFTGAIIWNHAMFPCDLAVKSMFFICSFKPNLCSLDMSQFERTERKSVSCMSRNFPKRESLSISHVQKAIVVAIEFSSFAKQFSL